MDVASEDCDMFVARCAFSDATLVLMVWAMETLRWLTD